MTTADENFKLVQPLIGTVIDGGITLLAAAIPFNRTNKASKKRQKRIDQLPSQRITRRRDA